MLISALLALVATSAASQDLASCPDPADTLWALDTTASIPPVWALYLIDYECRRRSSLPIPGKLGGRVASDSTALALYERILRGKQIIPSIDEPADTAVALHWLGWYAPPRYLDLMLQFTAQEPKHSSLESRSMPFGVAMTALARYSHQPTARNRLLHLLHRGGSPWVRTHAFMTLLLVNDSWARSHLPSVPDRELALFYRELRRAALAQPPCLPGTYWNKCSGIDFSPPPSCGEPPAMWRQCVL
jgi:hypothetical protein